MGVSEYTAGYICVSICLNARLRYLTPVFVAQHSRYVAMVNTIFTLSTIRSKANTRLIIVTGKR